MAERLGWLDVNAMLDTVTPRQFDEWVACKKLEPDKLDRLRVILLRGLECLCNARGAKITGKDLDPYYEDEEVVETTPEQAAKMMREAYGG